MGCVSLMFLLRQTLVRNRENHSFIAVSIESKFSMLNLYCFWISVKLKTETWPLACSFSENVSYSIYIQDCCHWIQHHPDAQTSACCLNMTLVSMTVKYLVM